MSTPRSRAAALMQRDALAALRRALRVSA